MIDSNPEISSLIAANLVEDAMEAFWHVVAQRFPQAQTGDLCPWTTFQLHIACENAIAEWIDNNVPKSDLKGE